MNRLEEGHGHKSLLESHPKSFVHLHLHTQYSLLDGAIRIKDLFAKAQEFGMPAVASTDHGNMFGAIDFYTAAMKASIRPILGSEIYFTPGHRKDRRPAKKARVLDSQDAEEGKYQIHHLILLAKNNTGYKNLCKLLSRAYLEGFYYKPRADIELLKTYREGLIATTACLKGEVGYNFFTGQDEKAHSAILKLREVFGDDFYLEVQQNGIEEQKIVNSKVISFAHEKSIPLVATNDCHYLTPEDAKAQEVLLCIQTGKTFSDEKRMKLTTDEFYFKSAEMMRESFSHIPEACDNTLRIADKCNIDLRWKDKGGRQIYHLPDFKIPTGESTEEYFRREIIEGLEKRFQGPHFRKLTRDEKWHSQIRPRYIDRLNDEMNMIIKMGFMGYFLIVSDFIKYAKGEGIPVGPGRGSGAGSIVAYALDITNIDPLPYNLLFERFINPERISMPDFDVDFCQVGRSKVIEYVTEKYGKDKVGQIITFGKLQAKAVIRDVSRVYDLAYSEADMLAKLVPDELGITLERALELEPKLRNIIDKDPKVRQIFNIAGRLEGLLRHASIHAAGVIITNKPLVEYCPLFKGREGEQVVQFDKDFSELIGLVKFDFLGLKTLTVIDRAQKFIQRDSDPSFDIESVDFEDEEVYRFISRGETIGVFQLESSGMIDLCKRIEPDTLDDITAINALYRPGPLESGMVDDFIEIKHGRKETVYPFDELEEVLKDTYGVIVYQEQVMNVARIIAGYSLGQADMLRRAMGKKKVEVMAEHKKIFLKGANENGFDEKKASALFDLMAKFAAYGFNKSHAVAYAYIAYQTAYLKHYHCPAFFAALLSTEMNNTDKVTLYINDAKSRGLEVLPPDINESLWLFNVVGDSIRFGMGAVKTVGESAVNEIISNREKEGPFKGILDFLERTNLKMINKRMLEALVKVGAFDQCEEMNRKTLLENLEMFILYASKFQEKKALGQGDLFAPSSGGGGDDARSMLDISRIDDFEEREKLSHEKQLMGIYISGHPLDRFQGLIGEIASMPLGDIQALPKGRPQIVKSSRGGPNQERYERELTLAGVFSSIKSLLTKKGDRMAFATLEDCSGKIECIIFPKIYDQYFELLDKDDPVVLTGRVNLNEEPRKFFPQKIQLLKNETENRVYGVQVSLGLEKTRPQQLEHLKRVCLSYRGSVPVDLIFTSDQKQAKVGLGDNFLVNPTPQLAAKINDIFQSNAVRFMISSSEDIDGHAS